jgi:hypothetical protein
MRPESKASSTSPDAESTVHKLQDARVNFVSSGVVTNQTGQIGFKKAFLIRHPDGHPIEIEEK